DDTKLKRQVAIKFLPSRITVNETDNARFLQEAQAAAAINHPNVCVIYEIQDQEENPFIVMEYVEGQTLSDKIASKPLPIEQVIEYAKQIGTALQAAHDKEIIHRDIKSDNIMISATNQVKVMDFGLAKIKGSVKITKSSSTVGTLAYMAPEQIEGKEIDARSDIFSFGVVLYEMLTGKLPFRGEYESALMYSILNEAPEPITNLRAEVPVGLEEIVFKMLEKESDRRFQNIKEIVQKLNDVRTERDDIVKADKEKAIAVLPFENISPEKGNDYFSDGLTEELIINLSRLKDMKVISRTTSMQYKGTKKNIKTIGKELGTRYIIEGSVRKYQDNLRISVQLIDVESDTQLWSETYKGKLADVFDIQEQVSKQIVDALLLKLTVTEKVVLTKRATLNAEAFDLNLRGRDFLNQLSKNKVKIAIQLFEKAIEIDPRYAGAYAGLGHAYAVLFQLFERKKDWLDKSIELSLKALKYDAALSEAYASLSLAYYNKDSLDEALAASQKAIELDPDNFIAYWILGRIYRCMDRDRESVDLFKKVTILNPEFLTAYMDLRMVYEKLGEKKISDEILQNILTIAPKYLLKHPDDARAHMLYAIHLAIGGRINDAKTESAKALELDPTDPLMQYNAACFYSRVGEKHLALESLKISVVSGYEYYEWIKRDPDLNIIRNEPEYIKLMEGK
ncbi:protein kinase, partial [bacterium]|nr:protein kinase [bacterium]